MNGALGCAVHNVGLLPPPPADIYFSYLTTALTYTVNRDRHLKSKLKYMDIAVRRVHRQTATGTHVPYGITVLPATRQR